MGASVVIELGEDRALPEVDPARPLIRPGLPAVAGLVAALLVLIGGSAPPPKATLTEARVPAGLGDFVEAVGERLYVAAADPLGAGARTLASYSLPDGRLLWRAPIEVRGPIRRAEEIAGVVVLDVENGPRGDTVAVAAQTGRPLWRRSAALLAVSPDRKIAVLGGLAGDGVGASDGSPADGDGGTVTDGVDIASGRTVWSYRVPNGYWHCVACEGPVDDPARSITTGPDGLVEIRDLDTGQVVRRGVVLQAGGVRVPLIVGRLLLITGYPASDEAVQGGPRGPVVKAYSLDTLKPLWQARLPDGNWFVTQGCGADLCLLGRDGGAGVLDGGTGKIRWTSPDWASLTPVADLLVAYSRSGFGAASRTAVLDPRSGRELRDLGHWDMMGDAGGGRVALMRRDPGTGRAWFGLADPSRDGVRILGAVADVSGDCQSTGRWILCRKLDASVGIWRY